MTLAGIRNIDDVQSVGDRIHGCRYFDSAASIMHGFFLIVQPVGSVGGRVPQDKLIP